MSDDPQAPVVKKKKKPYPFDAVLEAESVKKPVEIMLITPVGFLARLKPATPLLFVGEYYHTAFELPTETFVNSNVRVIKTYDRSVDPRRKLVERMVELRFEALSEDHKRNILSFMSAIGQK